MAIAIDVPAEFTAACSRPGPPQREPALQTAWTAWTVWTAWTAWTRSREGHCGEGCGAGGELFSVALDTPRVPGKRQEEEEVQPQFEELSRKQEEGLGGREACG